MAANATKTIEYALEFRTTALTSGVRWETAAVPIYIPEVSGRFIQNAFVSIYARDNNNATTTRGNRTQHVIGVNIDGAGWADKTVNNTLTDSVEHHQILLTQDFSANVRSAMTGVLHTFQTAFSFLSSVVANPVQYNNLGAKLTITYDYDGDNAPTKIKTVRIPVESVTSSLTNSLANVGNYQIPKLDEWLPETSKVYRNFGLQCFGNEAAVATTAYSLEVAIGTGVSVTGASLVQGCQSSPFFILQTPIASGLFDTSQAHNLAARSNNVTTRFNNFAAILTVTYEYDSINSTGIMNSVMLPFELQSPFGVSSGNASRLERTILISEPAPITIKNSAVLFQFNEAADVAGYNMRVVPQDFKTYTHTAGSTTCGQYATMHRFDPAIGTGITLNRGYNVIPYEVYATDTTDRGGNLNGCIYLNYTSSADFGNEHRFNNTTLELLFPTALGAIYTETSPSGIILPTGHYYYNSIGYIMNHMATTATQAISVATRIYPGEAKNGGWESIYDDQFRSDNELANSHTFFKATEIYNRYPGSPAGAIQMDRGAVRPIRIRTLVAPYHDLLRMATFHRLTFNMTGSLVGYVGDPSGTEVRFYGTSGYRHIGSTYADSSGAYSFPWYDDTEYLWCEAIDPSGYGRSTNTRMGT